MSGLDFSNIAAILSVLAAISGFFLYLGNFKSTAERNQRRCERLEEKIKEIEVKIDNADKVHYFLGNQLEIERIRISQVENHLSAKGDFSPASVQNFADRRQR